MSGVSALQARSEGLVPLSDVQFGSYIGQLSERVVDQLQRASPEVQKIWDGILQRAYILERVSVFDKEVLSRIVGFSIFNREFASLLHEIFMSSCPIVDMFLTLATTFRPVYYSREELLNLLTLFHAFLQIQDKVDLPSSIEDVPHFDGGGKEWLEALTQTDLPSSRAEVISTLALSKLTSKPLDLSKLATETNCELSSINYMAVSSEQICQGLITGMRLLLDSLPMFAHKKSSTEEIVLEKIKKYGIDPVHASRLIQICELIFGEDAPVSTYSNIEAVLFLFAKAKDMIGMCFFLLISQPRGYARGNPSFEDVLLMMQLLCQLNALGSIDDEVMGIAKEFHAGLLMVSEVVEKLQVIHHKVEENSRNPFVEKGFSADSLDDIECVRIQNIFSSIQWGRGEERTTQKDVVEELLRLKRLLERRDFYLLLHPISFQHVHSYTALYRLFHQIKIVAGMGGRIEDALQQLNSGRILLVQIDDHLEKMKVEMSDARSPEKDLKEIAQEMDPQTRKQIDAVFDLYRAVHAHGQKLRSLRTEELIQRVEEMKSLAQKRPLSSAESNMLLALAREAIRKEFGIYPYNTQVIAALGLLLPAGQIRGKIAQVKTGEGKSTIIALLAFYQAIVGKTVDIVSSSRYLSIRDEEKYRSFFATYGISTSHLCTDSPTKENFSGQIIFSTNFDLEWAVMHDYFRKQPMRTIERNGAIIKRPFEVVIVDEVDNLFIDSAMNSARVCTQGDEHERLIYAPLFQYVERHQQAIHELIQGGFEDKAIISELQSTIAGATRSSEVAESIGIQKLKTLVESAFKALKFRENEDYVVKAIERNGECKNEIVIVDKKNTGRLSERSRWNNGLHQFLELRHQLPVEGEDPLISSLCHPVYFTSYETIYGLTGTIGIEVEEEEIREMYGVDCFKIPPHRVSRRVDLSPIVCRSKSDYDKALIEEISVMRRSKRPTLLLLETIDETEKISALCRRHSIDCRVLNARQVEDESYLIGMAGMPGSVTIATNTAGRGTDIVLSSDSLSFGGLHVIFGYMPANDRVEMQGLGRCGRQGQPGSSRIIILIEQGLLRELEVLGMSSSAVDRIEYAFLRKLRDHRIALLSAMNRFRARVEMTNHRFHQRFVAQFAAWQEAAYRRVSHVVIEEVEAKVQKEFAARFYNKLDELLDTLEGGTSSLSSESIMRYEIEVEKLYNSAKPSWEALFSIADKK